MRLTTLAAVVVTALLTFACKDAGQKKKHEALSGYASYDATQNGNDQLSAAVAQAKSANKNVLVMFGGNWCKWCKAFDGLVASNADVKAALDKGYVLVHIDSDSNLALNKELGDPFKNGFPVLVVIGSDGKALVTQETGSLELADKSVGHDPQKVIAFLNANAPKA